MRTPKQPPLRLVHPRETPPRIHRPRKPLGQTPTTRAVTFSDGSVHYRNVYPQIPVEVLNPVETELLHTEEQENVLAMAAWSDEYGAIVVSLIPPELMESDYRPMYAAIHEYWQRRGKAPKDHTPNLPGIRKLLFDNDVAITINHILINMVALSDKYEERNGVQKVDPEDVLDNLYAFLDHQIRRQATLQQARLLQSNARDARAKWDEIAQRTLEHTKYNRRGVLDSFKSIDGDGSDEVLEPDLIEGLVPQSGLTVVAGQSQAGKTFVVMHLMTMVAAPAQRGCDSFFGHALNDRLGSVYITNEGQRRVKQRLRAARDALGLEQEPMPIRVWDDDLPALDDNAGVDAFVVKLKLLNAAMQREYGVRLGVVVIDTASCVFEIGKEEDNAEINRVCKRLKRLARGFGGVVIVTHHFGKEKERGERGAKAWRDNAEVTLFVLASIDPLTGKAELKRHLTLVKNRDGESGPVGAFELHKYSPDSIAPHVIEDLSEESQVTTTQVKAAKPDRGLKALLEAIPHCLKLHGKDRHWTLGETTRAVRFEYVRDEFFRNYTTIGDDPKKTAKAKRVALQRAMNKLPAEIGYGEREGYAWFWL
jgi:hypothetical protein